MTHNYPQNPNLIELAQSIADKIDPGLKVVEHYSNTQAYRVIKDDDTYILKIDKAANRYIDTEITALRRLADLPKIPNLIDVYMDKSEQYNWLLRENVEGKLFAEYINWFYQPEHDPVFVQKDAGKEFKKLVKQIHRRGVCRLDLHVDNVIIDRDGYLCLFDFNSSYIVSWLSVYFRADSPRPEDLKEMMGFLKMLKAERGQAPHNS
ncbi:MAG TPA: hypothetical protein VJC39_05250 [Candidatus Nanoarchaeia archaeon]|nr:hypothetical protein [Candidatus Nanoarchaeia archaeon]